MPNFTKYRVEFYFRDRHIRDGVCTGAVDIFVQDFDRVDDAFERLFPNVEMGSCEEIE